MEMTVPHKLLHRLLAETPSLQEQVEKGLAVAIQEVVEAARAPAGGSKHFCGMKVIHLRDPRLRER